MCGCIMGKINYGGEANHLASDNFRIKCVIPPRVEQVVNSTVGSIDTSTLISSSSQI